MSIIKVTFHRSYEINRQLVIEILENNGEIDITKEKINEKAAEIAMNYMSDEIVYFTNELNDFVSYTCDEIQNKC